MTTSEPTTGEIVRALRCDGDANNCVDCRYATYDTATILCDQEQNVRDAADRLERQEQTIAALIARAEQAEKNLHDAIFGTNHACFYCTMENCDGCTNSTVKEHFKYRALKPNKYLTIQDERGLPQDGEGKI